MSTGNNNALKQQIKHGSNLPVLPPGIVSLLKVLNNNDIHYALLATELEKFPSIAIKLVAIANSVWASPEVPITNLPDACSRIGLNIVRSVSIALSISQVFNPSRCPAFNIKKYWTSALFNAEAAFICAKDYPEICPNTARLAGLLHNIGLLWLASQQPVETNYAIECTLKEHGSTLAQSLNKIIKMNHYSVGGQLAMVMELPDTISSAISTASTRGLKSTDSLLINHCRARQLSSLVLDNMEDEDCDTDQFLQNSQYQQLAAILPKIKSMAETIFSS